MNIPRADLQANRRRSVVRWLEARLAPPSWLHENDHSSAELLWCGSGALAGAFTLALLAAIGAGLLFRSNALVAVGWLFVFALGASALLMPFLLTLFVYIALDRFEFVRRRWVAGVYGAIMHGIAHIWLFDAIGESAFGPLLLAPLLVGGLWGSWLPAAVERYSPRR